MLIAEARETALVGRSGVCHVAVRTADGRAIAEFTGFSRSLGGSVLDPPSSSPDLSAGSIHPYQRRKNMDAAIKLRHDGVGP